MNRLLSFYRHEMPIKREWIDRLILGLLILGIFALLLLSGTLTSGYHLMDDHEMLRISSDLQEHGVYRTTIQWLTNDLTIRFRPIYYVHRILELKLLGANFLALSIYTSLLACSTFSLLYLGARRLDYSIFESLFLVMLTFVGAQMAIWWRLGPSETIGMVFLGLSFYFMARCTSAKCYWVNSLLSNWFLLLASLSKESFVIIIPAFVLYKIWRESSFFNIAFGQSIRNNYWSCISIVVMLVEIWVIVFNVGTNQIGYAGLTSDVGRLFQGIWTILFGRNMLLAYCVLFFATATLFFIQSLLLGLESSTVLRQSLQELSAPLFLSVLIIVPNLILYAKSGMVDHYLVPSTLGIGFGVISMLKATRNKLLHDGALLVFVIFIAGSSSIAIRNAVYFAREGADARVFLAVAENSAKMKDRIVLVADPVTGFEASLSAKTYLFFKGIDIADGFAVSRNDFSDFEYQLKELWMKNFSHPAIVDPAGQPDIILLVYKSETQRYFSESGLSLMDYKNIIDDNLHAIYIKK